jgi:hypothetical protein
MRDRAATRALVLGLLALWFGILSPFAIFSGARSLRRIWTSDGELRGAGRAAVGLIAGIVGLAVIIVGAGYWWLASS